MNEELNLPACLDALRWCDDVVVVDSGSTDRSVEIAKAYGARTLTRAFDSFAGQRNFGLEQGAFRHPWVLHLDADEVTTPELVTALGALAPNDDIEAYRIPSKMMLFDRWIKHAGMYPTYQVRLGHRDRLRFVQVGHGQREDMPPERVGVLDVPYLHYSFSHGMFRWLQKHVRYAKDEAALILDYRRGTPCMSIGADSTSRRRTIKARVSKLPVALRPALRFIDVYFLNLGFRDGRAGFAYAFMLSVYEGMTAVFVLEALLDGRCMRDVPLKPGAQE